MWTCERSQGRVRWAMPTRARHGRKVDKRTKSGLNGAAMRGLYAIVDVTTLRARGLPVVEFARAVVAAKPCALQLRAKDASPSETLNLLRAIRSVCREGGVPLFANDRVDLACLAGCDGVHVGQDDMPVPLARDIAKGLRIGVSTHDVVQVERALADEPDYVAFGPVYPTKSKANPDPVVGIDALARVVERCPMPVVAIGGIDAERAAEVGRVCPVAAVIGALVPEGLTPRDMGWVTQRARDLHATLLRSWEQRGEKTSRPVS